ncbi:MAG: recombination regulator RecX [Mycobacteriaceae bacterium]|nr:recombination regulator RecX [Mycobacteriaceae bacterium]
MNGIPEGTKDGGTEAQAKELCLRLLTDRARSRAELAGKLAAKGFSDSVAEAALNRLTEVGLIDDEAFAQQWVRSRHEHAGKGRHALARELHRKGIAKDVADTALTEITAGDEHERAAELVRKKLRTMHIGDDPADRDRALRRLVGMLARRGYSQGTAYSVAKAELLNDP